MVEKYYFKGKCWSGVKHFWVIQNNKEIIDCINKLNNKSQAKNIFTFDFATLYTNIPHNKLFSELCKMVDLVFKGG